MRIPKAQLDRLMEESRDGAEVAEKIVSLYMGNNASVKGGGGLNEGKIGVHHQRSRRVCIFSTGIRYFIHFYIVDYILKSLKRSMLVWMLHVDVGFFYENSQVGLFRRIFVYHIAL